MHGIEAIAIFIAVVFVWRTVYLKYGNFGFWQLVAKHPDAAYEWMASRSDFVVLRSDDSKIEQFKRDASLVGPFKLYVPNMRYIVAIFAKNATIDDSQNEFVDAYGSARDRSSFSLISSLAMLYPIAAIMIAARSGSPLLQALGFGFANLGYILLAAGLIAGSFRVLGFRYRSPTILAAVTVWLIGTVLSNL